MDALEILALLLLGIILIAGAVWAVRSAKRGGKAIQAIGAALMIIGFGNLRDPSNESVQVAKQPRKKESGQSGDLLDDEL